MRTTAFWLSPARIARVYSLNVVRIVCRSSFRQPPSMLSAKSGINQATIADRGRCMFRPPKGLGRSYQKMSYLLVRTPGIRFLRDSRELGTQRHHGIFGQTALPIYLNR